jgi:RNA polymerase sigma-70 factor, ECF subfamily
MDSELVIRAQRGDHDAFAAIVAAISRRFHGLAFAILRDSHQAEDAAQQALVSVWRDLPKLRDPGHFEAWSYRLLVNACHMEGRRLRRFAAEVQLLPGPREAVEVSDPLRTVLDRDQIERGFRRLTLEQRTIVALYYFLGLAPERCAQVLEVPVGTVKSRLSRAVVAMRAALDADVRATAAAYRSSTTPTTAPCPNPEVSR